MADIIITLPTGTEITFDEKWKWFPLYEDAEELELSYMGNSRTLIC